MTVRKPRRIFKRTYALVVGVALAASVCTTLISSIFIRGNSEAPPLSPFYSASMEYSVFKTGTPVAEFPTTIERMADVFQPNYRAEGLPKKTWLGPKVDESKRALLEIPDVGLEIYGFTTAYGHACIIVEGLGAGCDHGVLETAPVVWTSGAVAAKGPFLIAGLARDDVQNIEVIINHEVLSAVLASNAFCVEIPLRQLDHRATLRVTLKNGDVTTSKLASLADRGPIPT
jgi:hypothetical protein